jgi:hypothetical protein
VAARGRAERAQKHPGLFEALGIHQRHGVPVTNFAQGEPGCGGSAMGELLSQATNRKLGRQFGCRLCEDCNDIRRHASR